MSDDMPKTVYLRKQNNPQDNGLYEGSAHNGVKYTRADTLSQQSIDAGKMEEIARNSQMLADSYLDRIEELEKRLEISKEHAYDGIYCRDETIKQLEKQNAKLRKVLTKATWALELAKSDVEQKGFKYGPKSTVSKTLKALAECESEGGDD